MIRVWSRNPRIGLANRRLQPLGHLSTSEGLLVQRNLWHAFHTSQARTEPAEPASCLNSQALRVAWAFLTARGETPLQSAGVDAYVTTMRSGSSAELNHGDGVAIGQNLPTGMSAIRQPGMAALR